MTILETIKDKIKKLRFLGKLDAKGFKKVLSLIILDDLCEWSNYLDAPLSIQKKLQDMRNRYILCQRDFIIKYGESLTAYVNVNIPLTNSTWLRVWDDDTISTLKDLYYINLSNTTVNLDEWIHVPSFTINENLYIKAIGNYVYPSDSSEILSDVETNPEGWILIEEVPIENEYISIGEYSINNEQYLTH